MSAGTRVEMLREYEQYSSPDVLLCWHSTKTLSIFLLCFVINVLLSINKRRGDYNVLEAANHEVI